MSNEVIRFNDQQVSGMTSLQIAEVTGRQHSHVIRDIRNLIERGASESNFGLSSYKQRQPNGGTKDVPMYELTPKGCLILASGYNVVLREKIIDKLEEYQQQERTSMTAIPDFSNPAEAARAWAEQYEQKMLEAKRADAAEQQVYALSQEIESMQPKVSYYDTILNNRSTVLTTQIALDYGMSAKAFNKKLFELRIQHKVGDQWILYAPYLPMGYMHSKPVEITHNNGTKSIKYNSEWTQKGRLFLYDELKKKNILPLIEQ
ncbi:MAG: phage regulatory protein/antirepressor Ant [Prevotella sp.]|nr:phage regulatory protein/antirepressor Ant [Prevotella sp.]